MEDVKHIPHSPRIDALRGGAVIAMIVAHALFFFHNGTIPFITNLESLLNMTVFTIFIFVAGLSLSPWIDTFAHYSPKHLVPYVAKRFITLYLCYGISAIVAITTTVPAYPVDALLSRIAGALTLLHPPNFTEYLPLFILLTIIQLPLRPLYRWTRLSLLLTALVGGFSYLLGITLYPMTLPPVVNELKELLAGGGENLRFPLLFYFPVYLLGLWWQHFRDHTTEDKHVYIVRTYLLIGAAFVSVATIVLSWRYVIPALDPATRWPPSIGYLASGITATIILMSLMPSFVWIGKGTKAIITYFGRDALDLWINHLLLLFLYRKFIGMQFDNTGWILLFTVVLLVSTIALSSLTFINSVVFPLRVSLEGTMRFRKRYVLMALITGGILLWTVNQPATPRATYGDIMRAAPFTAQKRLPENTKILLSTDRTWYAQHAEAPDVVDITVEVIDANRNKLTVKPESISININDTVYALPAALEANGTIHFSWLIADATPGTYLASAVINNGSNTLQSATKTIIITKPLMVAWTFDWEGWDVSLSALRAIDDMGRQFGNIPFTHFVNPRMFLPGVMPKTRQDELAAYLRSRATLRDEIAIHLHMHFDLVSAAGVSPRTTSAWGLRSGEGYDVPTTEYTADEFRQILAYARTLYGSAGLPPPIGYRAGGWFMNSALLPILEESGFAYDSSGRTRPTSGAFIFTPWNLSLNAQPYYPDPNDQNRAGIAKTGILEIPNNGLSTYESSVVELIDKLNSLYRGGYLTQPKTLVYVSHPQFATREFAKIPEVLSALYDVSIERDRGPVVFTTMADIYSLWTSSKH